MEQRRFHRVTFSAPSDLIHQDMTYRGRLDNISLRGAMVSADECIMIPPGDTCTLSIRPDEKAPPIILTAEIVHCFFSMVGVKFVAFSEDAEQRLFELIKTITPEPDRLRNEWEVVLAHRAGQQEG
ncbi:MAG: pilus assembly protein PilZ [Geobacteraceae bacterium GWC2_58_44]|nr:MAG: pilus assembly protein PilZ [Geobacteraceae bacterium GWC2_58_44]HBG05296.1 PilZ domain-containing protein [Geobacter sp.]